jgi:hypothetical protein
MDTTSLAAVINEVWSPQIEREFTPRLTAADFFKNVSDLYAGGGDIVHVPGIYGSAELSVNPKTGGSEYTLQKATMKDDTLTLDTWKEITFIIEKFEQQLMLQSANVGIEYSDQASKKIAKDLDTSIFTALTSGVTTNSVGSGDDNLKDGIMREAIEKLASKDIPTEELAFFINPTAYWHDMMGENKYVQAYVAGWPEGKTPVITGNFGNAAGKIQGVLYGIPVYVSTQVPKNSSITNFLAHPSALMYAVRTPGAGMVNSEAWEEKLKGGTVWMSEIMYGVDMLREDLACKIESNVGGIVS